MTVTRALLLLGLMIGYLLPWITVSNTASLTINAYDLAEWASLHPEVRAQPLLFTSLLLRLPLVLLALLLSLSARSALVAMPLLGIVAAALLPPFAFIANTGDPNYGQQFALALAALIGGLAVWFSFVRRWRGVVLLAIIAAGVLTTLSGFSLAHTLMRGFEVTVQSGGGVWFSLGIYALLALDVLRGELRQPLRLPLIRRAPEGDANSYAR